MAHEHLLCGFNAVMAAMRHRPQDIRKLYFTAELAPRFGKVCRTMAQDKKPYRTCTPDELEKIAHSAHHGGAVAVFTPKPDQTPYAETILQWKADRSPVLVLDGVSNPHNLGALVRTAAFMGLKHILADRDTSRAIQTHAAMRIAEGGYESVRVWTTNSVEEFITRYRERMVVLGTDQNARLNLRTAPAVVASDDKPLLIVLGNEESGLSPSVRALCHHLVAIAGSGAVESLNVVQAAAVIIWALSPDPSRAENAVPAHIVGHGPTAAPAPAKAKVTRIWSGLSDAKPKKHGSQQGALAKGRRARENRPANESSQTSPISAAKMSKVKVIGGKKVVLVKRKSGGSYDKPAP